MHVPSSNSLTDLAARIKVEHTAVDAALKDSLRHALAAGELLVEAKALVPHGQWLPWLRDRCAISERTAQLYMRCAKNRAEIECQIRNDVADLTLSEAAALLALSSDVRKLFSFIKEIEGTSEPEQIMQAAVAANVACLGVMHTEYDQWLGRSEEEVREWHVFMLFLVQQCGWHPEGAGLHIEWVMQRPFQNVAEWLGEEGDKFRKHQWMKAMPEAAKRNWLSFLERHHQPRSDIVSELEKLNAVAGPLKVARPRRRHQLSAPTFVAKVA
jgi:hypothetical protein